LFLANQLDIICTQTSTCIRSTDFLDLEIDSLENSFGIVFQVNILHTFYRDG